MTHAAAATVRVLAWGLSVAFSLSACAPLSPGPGGTSSAARSTDWVTESDESPVRQRARLHLALALAYYHQDQPAVALDEIKRGLLLDPNFVSLLNLRGLVYQRLGEPSLAEGSWRQALAVSPQDPDSLQNLGWALCQQSRPAEGLPLLARALTAPGHGQAKAWMTQGLCQKQAGLQPAAEQSFQRAVALDPANGLVAYELAQLLYQRGDWAGSRAQLSRLNAGAGATAQTIWLALRAERKLDNLPTVYQLGRLLQSRFAASPEAQAYERGLLHD